MFNPPVRRPPTLSTLLLGLLAACLAVPPVAAARTVHARLLSCHSALRPVQRSLTVEGEMFRAAAGERMQMRFDLLRRAPGGGFRRLPAPGLGVFKRAQAGVADYRFRKTIRNLPAPAELRVQVTFRWLTPTGREVARLVRSSPVCRQPELRPDLRVVALSAGSGGYRVVVRNAGASPALGFLVGVVVDGRPLTAQRVATLGPGESRPLIFAGPACDPGQLVLARVDQHRRVDEASELDNVRAIPCPGATAKLGRP